MIDNTENQREKELQTEIGQNAKKALEIINKHKKENDTGEER